MRLLARAITTAILLSASTFAQGNSAFDGDWKDVRNEADGKVVPSSLSTLTISIGKDEVRFRYARTNKKGKVSKDELLYYTDGKPFNSPSWRGMSWTITARWEDGRLVAVSKPPEMYRDIAGGKVTEEEIWSLSTDGSELTRTRIIRNAYACEGNAATSLGPCRTRDMTMVTIYRRPQ